MNRLFIPALAPLMLASLALSGTIAHAAPPNDAESQAERSMEKRAGSDILQDHRRDSRPGDKYQRGKPEHSKRGVTNGILQNGMVPDGLMQTGPARTGPLQKGATKPGMLQKRPGQNTPTQTEPWHPVQQNSGPQLQSAEPTWEGSEHDVLSRGQSGGMWQGKPLGPTEPYAGPSDYMVGHPPGPYSGRPHDYDPNDYHHNYQAQRRFNLGRYERPHGWYERSWSYGETLPSIFWSRNYWIDDYWMFGLTIPPYDCQWVRYGDDALLINADSGDILQVVYGLFY
ncbi:RcnB family protein [Parvibaculum sp.]|uniref:RcnB family protein n=1 Tax=Parvibaculum sp. TaxID=2024848 RepID=UPI00320C11FC